MAEPNYWTRWAKRRLSRRRLLTGAAGVGAGLAALSLVGCGGGEEGAEPIAGGVARGIAGRIADGSPTATPRATCSTAGATGPPPALEPAKTRGGMQRWFGFEAMPLDTFDPHQTQFGPTSQPALRRLQQGPEVLGRLSRRDRARPGGGHA